MNPNNDQQFALPDPQVPPAKILVIRFKFIGDVMLTSVICNTLKQTFPDARVDYLMQDTSVDLFTDHPFVDRVIGLTPAQRKNPLQYWRLIRKLRAERYDLIIDAQSTNKSEMVSMLAPKAAIRIGRQKKKRGFFYTHKVDTSTHSGDKISERLLMLEPLADIGFSIKWHRQMVINVPDSSSQRMQQLLQNSGVKRARPVFVFAVTAKLAHKKWRSDYMHEVAVYCMETFNAQIVLFAGSERERSEIVEFAAHLPRPSDVHAKIQTRSLMDLAALIAQCDLFVGNEGGPRHIAQAVSVPSVAIFSPSAKKSEWLPNQSKDHQGVEWDDLADDSHTEKAQIHASLEIGSEQYRRLYNSITPQPVLKLIDDITARIGIARLG